MFDVFKDEHKTRTEREVERAKRRYVRGEIDVDEFEDEVEAVLRGKNNGYQGELVYK